MAATASLSATNTPGPGTAVPQSGSLVSAQIVPSDDSAKFQVAIEATIDGTNWTLVGVVNRSGFWTSSQYAFVSVRANLLSVSSGTITATFNTV